MRCVVFQADLQTSSTCDARLAWLDRYEKKGRVVLNTLIPENDKIKYSEYLICRKCKKVDAAPKQNRKRPKIKTAGNCKMEGCDRPIRAKGLCGLHYDKAMYWKRKEKKNRIKERV